MCVAVIFVLIVIVLFMICSSKVEKYGRGAPLLDFLPTVGEFPTGEGGYLDEEEMPF